MTHPFPEQACLACGHVIYLASALTEKANCPKREPKPRPGDFTLCIRCGCLMVWTRKMRFRLPSPDELKEVKDDARITVAIAAIEHVNKRRPTT